ncbi:hypothetical protein F5876DRAFT_76530 [Lentinula aff. lateritia]|uniref:Uncharacterized protein n=1 Tax=Lentinula aff. lateritia TaxID=2804960 RepID=A0ACC1U0V8_9AGAR|nr:hypothetical protein F5876DRAFT_76530 [Lentinula aff. lateritia]
MFSKESMMHINKDGHLVETSLPPNSAGEVTEDLQTIKKGSASWAGGSIPMELDLPSIKILAEPTPSPVKGAEEVQTLKV